MLLISRSSLSWASMYLLPRSLLWKARWQEEYMTLCLTLLASGALEAIRAIQKRSRTRKWKGACQGSCRSARSRGRRRGSEARWQEEWRKGLPTSCLSHPKNSKFGVEAYGAVDDDDILTVAGLDSVKDPTAGLLELESVVNSDALIGIGNVRLRMNEAGSHVYHVCGFDRTKNA